MTAPSFPLEPYLNLDFYLNAWFLVSLTCFSPPVASKAGYTRRCNGRTAMQAMILPTARSRYPQIARQTVWTYQMLTFTGPGQFPTREGCVPSTAHATIVHSEALVRAI